MLVFLFLFLFFFSFFFGLWKFWKVARWTSKKRTVARWCCLLRTLHSRLFSRGRRLSWGRNKAQQQQVWHCRGVPVCLLTSNSVPPSAFQARSYERSSPPTSLSGGPPTERQGVPNSARATSSQLPEKYITIDPTYASLCQPVISGEEWKVKRL